MNNFYLVCPIGLEEFALKEIKLKKLDQNLNKIKLQKGGIELECALETGLSLNYSLKTVTRILLRIKERKCRDFPKLFKVISTIDWRNYLVQENAEWRITTSKSRIINTAKAEETCKKALKKYFEGQPLKKATLEKNKESPLQKIFIRIENDELSISLDTSGDLLHIRGGRSDRGKASIRESYAALLLMTIFDGPTEKTLVDPMCGTGTFLNEALDFFKPHPRNEFPFNKWKHVGEFKTQTSAAGLVQKSIGLDLDPRVKERSELTTYENDIFKGLGPNLSNEIEGQILVCNFPYGKRVKIEGERVSYFKNLIEVIENEYKPEVYGVIIPADVKLPFEQKIAFNNNGIKVNFCIKRLRDPK